MPEEPLVVRGIHWREAFPFTHLFRAFRVAIHPSKILLALVALLLLYVGGQLLDACWAVQDRAVPNEVLLYEQFSQTQKPGQNFSEVRRAQRATVETQYARALLQYKIVSDKDAAARAAHDADYLGTLKQKILDDRATTKAALEKAHDAAVDKANRQGNEAGDRDRRAADATFNDAMNRLYAATSEEYAQDCRVKNQGLYDVYFDYESNQVSNVVRGVRDWNWFDGDRPVVDSLEPDNPLAVRVGLVSPAPGVLPSTVRFFAVGPVWLMTQHWLYFALFGSFFLVLWSVFGGAICRIAAVHVARDEKLSIRAALVFSVNKFLSFLCAPIIPLLIVISIGLCIAVVSLLGNVPVFGPILLGAGFVLALVGGFVMALVLLGLIGGFNLMYPTVAVEGSDSFDAISRSFSYLYARPWRLGFYTVVSIIYGAVTFLFVRLFIYLILLLTHKAVGLGVFASADSTAPLFTSLWPSPGTAARLSYDIDTISLGGAQEIGARLIWFWVHLVIALLGAFTVCLYFSANTIIYYLMRREVDATDLDDVYLEQTDDEFADPAGVVDPSPPAPSTVAVEAASEIAPPT